MFWSAIALVVTTSISFIFTRQIFHFLLRPSGGIKPVFIEVTEMVGTYFRVAFLSGIALALPVIIYELVLFISPGLTPKERRFLFWLLPGAFLLFIAGALFSYFILLPPAMHVLLTFGSDIAEPQIRIGNYISVITRLMFWSGLIFEMPLVSFFLAKIGIVTYDTLSRLRRWAIVGAFVMAAIITPTFDPINQTLMALPLIVLYEISIWISKLAAPRQGKEKRRKG